VSISDIGISEADLPTRLKIVNLLPVTLVVAALGILLLAGAPAQQPDYNRFLENAHKVGWPVLVAASVTAVVVGILLQPLELASVRLLEGYWRTTGPLACLTSLGTWIQIRRRDRFAWIRDKLDGTPDGIAADIEMQNFPTRFPVLPTALGNRLRGMEERAGEPYKLDVIHLWPRLYLVLEDDVLKKVDIYRNQLDTSCRLCIACGFAAVATGALLLSAGLWLALPAAFALLAVLAYRAALHAAASYGVAVCATVDVYRLKLLQTAKIRLPANWSDECNLNERLSVYWARRGRGLQESVDYSQTDNDLGILKLNSPPEHG